MIIITFNFIMSDIWALTIDLFLTHVNNELTQCERVS